MTFAAARGILQRAIAARVAPAAAIDVGSSHGPRWQEAFGRLGDDEDAPAATLDTVFDLASLTKVIATTSLVMRAVADGRLRLNQPAGDVLDGWRDAAHAGITVRHLLDHSSGLPGHVKLWQAISGRDAYDAAIRAIALEGPPGAQSVYSDLGFIVLGFILERIDGGPLDQSFDALQRAAWGGALTFHPDARVAPIAPTELDSASGRALCGIVHDENARALGGVAGHAGLFGTVGDVGRFAQLVLATFRGPTALATPDLMRTFARETGVPGSSRALGWDVMRPTSSCGSRLSSTAIGHTGFTGTSLWIDFERDLYVVLLTNRVHPTRTNEALLAVRPALHDAIASEL